MKKLILLFFSLLFLTLSAQQLINNKGNRNQSYPVITQTNPEIVQLIDRVCQDSLEAHINLPYISSFNFSPNPASTYINIVTEQYEPYHIAIYDITGKVVFAQDAFYDGALSVAHLKKGTYLVLASTKQHRVARKLIIN